MNVTLLCSVRGCRLPLAREQHRLTCPHAHSFDVARRGYVNLLQPQDRRSARPGDSAAAVAARRRFLSGGFEAELTRAIGDLLTLAPGDALLEVGCGEGHYLHAFTARFGCEGHGVDLSVPAIEAAARHAGLHLVVANADRALPYADASFAAVASITARRNPAEFRRVIREDGRLLLVIPGPDDLVELREAVLGRGLLRDRVDRAVAAFAPRFRLERHERLRHVTRLDAAAIRDVMTGSYRAGRASRRDRLAALGPLAVTLSRDALLFRPVRPRADRGRAGARRSPPTRPSPLGRSPCPPDPRSAPAA
jgi:23S rRNA (guanine745-N1)-methyltransferase